MTAEELLTINPILAAKMMAARVAGHPATADWFVVKDIYNDPSSQECEIYFEYNELYVPLEFRYGKEQPIKLIINKIDLSLLNDEGPIDLTISSIFNNKSYIDLLNEKYDYVRMMFVDEDIHEIEPNVEDNKINASYKSLRWYNKADVNVTIVMEDINRFIKRSDLVLDFNEAFTEDTLLYNLISALNRVNVTEIPVAISESFVAFVDGVPEVIGNETDKVNTSIDLEFTYPYSGTLKVNYSRRTFHRSFNDPVHIKTFADLTPEDVLVKINEKYNSGLTIDELEPFTIETEMVRGNEELKEGKYLIKIKESSIAHFGDIWFTLEKDYEP